MRKQHKAEAGGGPGDTCVGNGQPEGFLRFPPFTVNLKTRELFRQGRRLRLADKPFLVLAALLERPGELVTREELRRRLWSDDTFVDFDNNLNSAVASLRAALGDTARSPRFIETLPRLGYRFVGVLEPAQEARAPAKPPAMPDWLPSRSSWAGIAALILLAALLLVGAGRRIPSDHVLSQRGSQAYADGLYLLQRGDSEGLQRAAALLEQAALADPGHAPAHAALAEAWLRLTLQGLTPKGPGFARAEQWSRRALALEPATSAAHRTLAMIQLHRDWNLAAADRESARALAVDPTDPRNSLVVATVKMATGQPEGAIEAARRAVELDPANLRVKADLAFFLLAAGRYPEAASESRQLLALEPKLAHTLDFLMTATERMERYDEACDTAVKLMELSGASPSEIEAVRKPASREGLRRYRAWQVRRADERAAKQSWPPMTAASIYASAGQTDKALAWLRRAYDEHDVMFIFLSSNPDLDSLRHDPRFAELARQAGVPLKPLT